MFYRETAKIKVLLFLMTYLLCLALLYMGLKFTFLKLLSEEGNKESKQKSTTKDKKTRQNCCCQGIFTSMITYRHFLWSFHSVSQAEPRKETRDSLHPEGAGCRKRTDHGASPVPEAGTARHCSQPGKALQRSCEPEDSMNVILNNSSSW